MYAFFVCLLTVSVVWVAYCSALVFQPAFPREITHDHLPSMQNDNQLLNVFKESRIWLWKDLAMNTKDAILALLYWEQFFLMYFQAMSKSAATSNWFEMVSNVHQ